MEIERNSILFAVKLETLETLETLNQKNQAALTRTFFSTDFSPILSRTLNTAKMLL
jgi:hypothetical protein